MTASPPSFIVGALVGVCRNRIGSLVVGLASLLAPTVALAGPAEDAAAAQPPDMSKLVPPELLNSVTVDYPPDLATLDEPPQGQVVVKFAIGVDGVTKEIEVEQSLHPELDALATQAVSKLRYSPATYDGQPVEIVNRIGIDFAPPPPPEPEPEPPPEVEPPGEAPPEVDGEPLDSPPNPVDDNGPVRIDGIIKQAGDRVPLSEATVVVVPAPADARVGEIKKTDYSAQSEPAWQAKTLTDDEGNFALRGIPSGKVRVIVIAPGFERAEFIESLPEGEAITVKYFALRLPSNPYRTVVRTENPREEVARRSISVEEINSLPGTQGDALKAVQNFPGVARAPFGAGLLAIRGTGPNDSSIYLGYHEIPTLFHFGGLTSVFNSDILERIDFVPGNFDPRYGNAIGGIIDVTPRAGRRDGFHGYIDADLFDAGILFEGPIGKGSFAISGRRSYIDAILPVVLPDDAGLSLTVAPRYYDYQLLFDYPVGKYGKVTVRGFGSDDRSVLVASNPNDITPDQRDQFENTQYFHRADFVYEWKKGPWSFFVTPSYRFEFFQLNISDQLSFDLSTHFLDGRTELTRQLTKRSSINVGLEYRSTWFEVDVSSAPIPDMTQGSSNARLSTTRTGHTANPNLYTTLTLGIGPRFTLYPGLRFSYWSFPEATNNIATDPRVRFGWQVGDNTTIKGGVGLYSQTAEPVEADTTYGNPRVLAERSVQTSLGVGHQFPYDINLDATVFFNYLWDGVTGSTETVVRDGALVPENNANTETGRVYGAEILLRKELTSNFFGWLAYTISRSERRQMPGEPYRLFGFDQTHILTLIGVYKLPKGWQVGARFRLVSGNPDTPIVGAVYDQSSGSYVPINGEVNSDRFPVFHQLDIRVDKKWTWKRLAWTLYLDVQNVYNAQNVEFWQYSFDFTQRSEIPSLPIIPSIGTKLEF